jgi:hypothetical protein
LFIAILQGCKGGYSFTGTSISPEVQTVSIEYINNMAMIVYPPLSNSLTEALKDKFTRTTRLSLVSYDGDLHFEGEITGYTFMPLAVSDNMYASQTRLTITIRVRFTNKADSEADFEKSFSAKSEFDNTRLIDEVQDELCVVIIKEIIDQIFNETVANW